MNRSRVPFAAAVAGCLAIVALWVSGQSFWIDECNAAVKAIQPDLRSFWTKFSGMGGSDFQMPLYMFLLWFWEKIAGRGEFALRALNILFGWSAILLVASRTSLPRRFRLLWCVAAAVSPMLAVYMDEARPYALQFLAAAVLYLPFLSGTGRDSVDGFDFRTFSIGLILLCGSSLTGVVFAFWPCLWLFILLAKSRAILRFVAEHATWIAIDSVLLTALAAFYLHTLAGGARASSVGATTLSSTVFCLYELFGFLGVGPSRLALRSSQVAALKGFILPLVFYAAAFVPVAVCVCRGSLRSGKGERAMRRSVLPVWFAGFGILSMLFVGITMEMRVLARHLMPALPAILFLFVELVSSTWSSVRFSRVAVGLVFLAFLSSCASFRFQPRHAKDDYRRAAAIARKALSEGKTVWWSADAAALEFYEVPEPSAGNLCKLVNPSMEQVGATVQPDFVILSKPDLYDAQGQIRAGLSEGRFSRAESFPAFQVFVR